MKFVDEEACARRSGRALFFWRGALKVHIEGGTVSGDLRLPITGLDSQRANCTSKLRPWHNYYRSVSQAV